MPAPTIDPARSLLLTDLYQFNMAEAYLAEGMTAPAVFELFARKLPPCRGFLLAAGLEQAVEFLRSACLTDAEVAWLRETGRFTDRLIDFLAGFRFDGDVDAPPEGALVFPDEPLIRVTAPLPVAQIMETRLMNFLHYQTVVATKAARMALAAPDAALVDFGLRRAHAGEAGLLAARASYIGGFAGTATVAAERLYGAPLFGTMAHSYIQAHDSETDAFVAFGRARPDQTTFLVDTYDTEEGAERATQAAAVLAQEGIETRGVRLDSGDLGDHARRVRAILDRAGLTQARIVASGGLDEYELERLTREGAPIDAYGIGTSLVVSDDLPALDCAYKIKAYDGIPRRKRSEGKSYWPGPTQAHRRLGSDGRLVEDLLTAADEPAPADAEPLLRPVLRRGEPVGDPPSLSAIRDRAAAALAALPEPQRDLRDAPAYTVRVSDRLQALAREADRRTGLREGD